MIVVADTATFEAPVTLFGPGEEGKMADLKATITFNYFTHDEFTALNEKLKSGAMKDEEFLRKIVAGWGDDIVDKNKKPLSFNSANLKKLLNVHGMVKAMIYSYFTHVNAESVKNLQALLSPAAAAE